MMPNRLGPDRLPWRDLVRWSLIATVLVVLGVLMHLNSGGGNPLALIQPGGNGPSAAAIHHDFPHVQLPSGLGLDGQQYYAIARDPFHLKSTGANLDRPRYRYQRPLLPVLAWALHPSGGGTGLVWALFAVGMAGVFIGCLSTGALSVMFRGPPWLGAAFALLPGVWYGLRVTVSDCLAVALALAAVALAARCRWALAIAVGVLAVLAKEPAVLILIGWALWRRTRRDTLVAAIPLAVIVLWMGALRVIFPGAEASNGDLTLPFVGLVGAWTHQWSYGRETLGMISSVGALGAGIVALWQRGLRHPLGWAVALHLAFFSVMGRNPIGMSFGGTRSNLALAALDLIALATPHPTPVEPASAPGERGVDTQAKGVLGGISASAG